MRTDVKVGLLCAVGLVLLVVAYFAYHSTPDKKSTEITGVTAPATPVSGGGFAAATTAPSTAPASAPESPIASSGFGLGPRAAMGQVQPDNGGAPFGGQVITLPQTPTTAPSSTSLVGSPAPAPTTMGSTISTGGLGGPVGGSPSGSLLPPPTGPSTPASPSLGGTPTHSTIDLGSGAGTVTPSHRSEIPTPSSVDTLGGSPSIVSGEGGTHKIEKGDMLSTIAKKYGTTVKAIQVANPGINPNGLKVGTTIKIPASTGSHTTSTIGTLGAADITPTPTTRPSHSTRTATTRPSHAAVASGRRHHAAGTVPAAADSSGTAASSSSSTSSAGSGAGTYTVKKGDTLAKIAKATLGSDTAWKKIAAANHISDPNTIKVGDVLKIPAK